LTAYAAAGSEGDAGPISCQRHSNCPWTHILPSKVRPQPRRILTDAEYALLDVANEIAKENRTSIAALSQV